MKVNFQYNQEKDVWCLLTRGKSSSNSQMPTPQYKQLVAEYGENPTSETAAAFIEKYLKDNNIDLQVYTTKFQKEWDEVSGEYQKRAEEIFKTSLPSDITAFITINGRCPYSIEHNNFFVSLQFPSARKTTMHELWHFYTWYGLGVDQEKKLGAQKYNDLKEALTVLLNEECRDFLPEGVSDLGYPQHQELRAKILEFWKNEKDIFKLWQHFTQ